MWERKLKVVVSAGNIEILEGSTVEVEYVIDSELKKEVGILKRIYALELILETSSNSIAIEYGNILELKEVGKI